MTLADLTYCAAVRQSGLLDEMLIHLAPVLLGEGIRLFEHIGIKQIDLESTSRREKWL